MDNYINDRGVICCSYISTPSSNYHVGALWLEERVVGLVKVLQTHCVWFSIKERHSYKNTHIHIHSYQYFQIILYICMYIGHSSIQIDAIVCILYMFHYSIIRG